MKNSNSEVVLLPKGIIKKKATKPTGSRSNGFGSNMKSKWFAFMSNGQLLGYFQVTKVFFY